MKKPMTHVCVCCGHEQFNSRCPACGFKEEQEHSGAHREQWIQAGMPWVGPGKPPKGWNASDTLAQLARKATAARVHGRRPRMLP